jgi:hypothetical protein
VLPLRTKHLLIQDLPGRLAALMRSGAVSVAFDENPVDAMADRLVVVAHELLQSDAQKFRTTTDEALRHAHEESTRLTEHELDACRAWITELLAEGE